MVVTETGFVRVPALTGLRQDAAALRLQELGLKLTVADRRFSSSAPEGTIIDQQPAPGTRVGDGTTVRVSVSAGSETFPMPDIVGQQLDQARKRLRERGLNVEFQSVPSEKEQHTVISSIPSPGQNVSTGDTVRLTVAAGIDGAESLLPSDFSGKTFVLDPTPVPSGLTNDPPMDVARRVRALLEASGARVVLTRSVTDTGDAAGTVARAKRAREASGTALLGFSVTQSGASGMAVVSIPNTSTTRPYYLVSLQLTEAMSTALKSPFPSVGSQTTANDTILLDTGVPAVRLRLGSVESGPDKLTFTDPDWADTVAKAVYRALAKVYAK